MTIFQCPLLTTLYLIYTPTLIPYTDSKQLTSRPLTNLLTQLPALGVSGVHPAAALLTQLPAPPLAPPSRISEPHQRLINILLYSCFIYVTIYYDKEILDLETLTFINCIKLDKLVKDPIEGNAWHADHIVPVYKGGGECMLENMRTLCVACHYDVTKAQCAERRLARAKAKKQLKAAIDGLRNVQHNEQTDINVKDRGNLEPQENALDNELLVKVPGSAYSSGNNTDVGNEKSTDNEEIPVSTDSI
ncbi:Zinc finger Ran-binding domain-containing protein 3 [Morus notabilis]|uniref:Zinc finger Ran-binding domain-containing protein 3 n=1 Tax=Morus notabilis TaxID=981085 RepID=W9RUU8_9ROSA|nr:Zinc finger Ran-binding domain-containing protein 3 [Morus notabilis]